MGPPKRPGPLRMMPFHHGPPPQGGGRPVFPRVCGADLVRVAGRVKQKGFPCPCHVTMMPAIPRSVCSVYR